MPIETSACPLHRMQCCTQRTPNTKSPPSPRAQAAWKLLGDALLQHAAVTPLSELRLLAGAPAGAQAAEAAGAAVQARAKAVRGARVAYSKALHLDPTQGRIWTTPPSVCLRLLGSTQMLTLICVME